MYQTLSFGYDYPVKGGPSINLELCKNSSSTAAAAAAAAAAGAAAGGGGSSSVPPNKLAAVSISPDSAVRFYILGNDRQTKDVPDKGSLWEEASKTFGPLAVSVVRSFLPITLKDKSTVG